MKMGPLLAAAGIAFAITISGAASARADAPAAKGPQKGGVILQVADAVFARPVLLVGALGTTALFVAYAPVSYFTGTSEEASEILVRFPLRYVSGRPLGNFTELYPQG